MKIKLLVMVGNDFECADFYVNTGGQMMPVVQKHECEIEIPDLPEGWCVRSIHREKPAEHPGGKEG